MKLPTHLRGLCGRTVKVKIWKSGHSFACEGYGMRCVRYWKPEPSIEAELIDYCQYCGQAEHKLLEIEK